ncbi:hypothetical protein AVEN_63856-1 [Araneus ventricosus]|uniref:Uncharacterized protein n=1 Tax=Araneus ventricosus TaxID=182803 RepID=A0A4Y2JPY2_ARAVE|nr:hypothetical protein AVEN_63856-1 [Araneus ventricosus]
MDDMKNHLLGLNQKKILKPDEVPSVSMPLQNNGEDVSSRIIYRLRNLLLANKLPILSPKVNTRENSIKNGAKFARRGGKGDLPKGTRSPRHGARPAVLGDECNEIGLKFSSHYYLSTTVGYPVQIFSPTVYKIFPRWGGGHSIPDGGPVPPLAPPLDSINEDYLDADILKNASAEKDIQEIGELPSEEDDLLVFEKLYSEEFPMKWKIDKPSNYCGMTFSEQEGLKYIAGFIASCVRSEYSSLGYISAAYRGMVKNY